MGERRVAVVVEDDEDIRSLLEAVLQQSGFEVHIAATGEVGVELAEAHRPDLVTLDLGLPDIDGFEVARRIRRVSDAHIVMLSARAEEIDTILGLETGADDYLTKPFRPRELRARVEAMMRRRTASKAFGTTASEDAYPSTGTLPVQQLTVLELNGLVLNPATHSTMIDGTEVALTPTEFIILNSLLEAGRVVLTKSDLVRRLRDEDFDAGTYVSTSDERSVEVHLGNLRRKLRDDARTPRWIETVRGVGYRSAPRV
ncbi:response regulator transcription factor [Arthrobacter halodurans]|uniref:Response regulator transcription factor n=1 Tax=Arthrobacter halodurans TaxID=516699 RepID=A0ABV4UK31_9MICC